MKTFLLTLTLLLLGVAVIGIVDYAIFQPKNPGGIVFSLLSLVLGVASLFTLKRYMRRGVRDIKSFSHFVQIMVDGLKAEHVEVYMYRFLYHDGSNYMGCAATNAICELTGLRPSGNYTEAKFMSKYSSLAHSYNSLRSCNIWECLHFLDDIKLSFKIDEEKILAVKRPYDELLNVNWRENLHYYQEYADRLKAAGL